MLSGQKNSCPSLRVDTDRAPLAASAPSAAAASVHIDKDDLVTIGQVLKASSALREAKGELDALRKDMAEHEDVCVFKIHSW
jgi:hypothetical protein